MKIIILAAGKGSRISKKIGDIPKSMVDVDGQPLLRRTVRMLKKHVAPTDIHIVTGYKRDVIEKEFCDEEGVRLYVNPFFPITNSIASLWFASDVITGEDDILICNADVFWSEQFLPMVEADAREVVMLSDATRVLTGDYFFREEEDHGIVAYGKELPPESRSSEYTGIARIRKSFALKFKERLLQMIDRWEFDKWWEDVLYSFVGENRIYSLDVGGRFWAEVDYIEDYERILEYVAGKKKL